MSALVGVRYRPMTPACYCREIIQDCGYQREGGAMSAFVENHIHLVATM